MTTMSRGDPVKHTLSTLFVAGALLLAGCAPRSADQAAGPHAWIDSPLTGSSFPVAPLEFVAHASDPAGIAQIEFSVDGATVGSVSADTAGLSLETARQPWTPPSAGRYTLSVRAQNRAGSWGGTASAVFQVGLELSATAIPAVTLTPTPTATPAPAFVQVGVSPKTFNHQNANQATCSPNQINLQVTVGDPQAVAGVVLFYQLSGGGTTTAWNEGTSMSPLGSGRYAATLAADAVPGAAGFVQATLNYQFVAIDAAHQVVGRSPVYSDVTLGTCP
jgi:hypothetical protein